ncbi:hypothetical protein ACQ4PT_017897 [Festuca glaucescens]
MPLYLRNQPKPRQKRQQLVITRTKRVTEESSKRTSASGGGEMTSGKDNRASSTEDGEIYPTSGDNGGGASGSDGFNLSSENQEIEEMRRRLRQMEEQEILPAVTAAVSHEDPASEATAFDKSEVDARSIYVGNVDYTCLPEEVQQHFEDCGTVNRSKKALLLNDTELHERRLKVCPKRTNVPGINHPRGRRPYDPYYPPYPTYGRVPRFRRPPRYWPY